MSYNKDEKHTSPISAPEAPQAPGYTQPETTKEKSGAPKILIAILILCAAVVIGWKLYPLASDDSWQNMLFLANMEHDHLGEENLQIGVVPYDTSSCIPWDEVEEAHIGKEVCVTGTIIKSWYEEESQLFLGLFSSDFNDFVLLSEDHSLQGITGHCVVATGLIEADNQSLVMLAGRDIVYLCDQSETPKPTMTPNVAEAHPLDPVPFDTSHCMSWDEVNGGDVGDVVCVTGVVDNFYYDRELDSEYINFDENYESLFLVVPRGFFANLWNKCVVATGEILDIEGTFAMVVYTDSLFACAEE